MPQITLRSVSNQFVSIAFTILFLILYPTFVIIFLPVYLFRLVVSILKLMFRPDLDKMIVTRSSILAVDNPYKNPKWNLCVWLTIDGDVDVDQFREGFNKDVILRKSPQGKLIDPEFQQYYYKWLGFLFWKWEDHFDVKYHVRSYFESKFTTENKITTLEELTQIIKKLTWSPFKEKTSPWEFLFIRKCEYDSGEPKFVAIFRFHHGFSDGFAILRLLLNKVCGVSMATIAQPENFSKSRNRRIRDVLTFPFFAPYQFCKMLVNANDQNDWHKLKDKDLTRPFNFAFSERVSTEFIKNVKNMHDVSFTAVVMCAIAGGLRRAMIQQGIKVPKNINAGVPVPMPGHPTKMRNHFIFSFMKLPIGMEDPVARLWKTEKNVRRLKKSHAPLLNFSLVPLVGGLFHWLMKPLNSNSFSTTVISNFPGPSERGQFTAAGALHTVTDMNFTGGLGSGNVGIGISILSYGDGLRIISEVDRSILATDEAVQQLNKEILLELQLLYEFGNA